MNIFLTALLILLWFSSFAQSKISDLVNEIEQGNVKLESINGNGNSSGAALYGEIVNQTKKEKRINVFLNSVLYFLNRSSRQNMIATRIYLRDGGYFSDGKKYFITLKPRQRLPIYLYSYCADFDKDNPSIKDTFTRSRLPDKLSKLLDKIKKLEQDNPEENFMAAIQVAIWLNDGASAEEIKSRFEFTRNDEIIAKRLLQD
jgi:hypothetical protein